MSFFQHIEQNNQILPQFQNGRVINVNEKPVEWFQSFDENRPNDSLRSQALYGIQTQSTLSDTYFSKANVKLVNDMIRYNVYKKSNQQILIGDQSTIQIEILMRSIFLQHARHSGSITEQIKELNMQVVDASVNRIISEALQYNGYLKSISTLPLEIDLPKNVSNKGTKNLRSVTSTF